jgi:transposase
MRPATLLPDADTLHLETLVADADRITVVVTTCGATACCPDCGQPSRHLHSRKRRRLADLPWQGLAVCLDLQLRRFYCQTPACARRTFTERVPTVVAPYARGATHGHGG